MSIEEIRTLSRARPFTPFTILMNDGRLFTVARPARIALAPKGDRVALFEGKGLHELYVSEIRMIQPAESEQQAG